MKINLRNYSKTFFIIFLFFPTLFLYGCATTSMDRSVKASKSIDEVEIDIKKTIDQADTTSESLNSLVLAREPDLRNSFDLFSNNLTKLETQGKVVLAHIEEMKVRSKEYFAEWEKEGDTYKNQQIRELSEQRRNELSEVYSHVPVSSSGITRAYLAYLSDLKEIQQYLSNDLTPKGIEAIGPVTKKSFQDLEELKTTSNPVLSDLAKIKAELYSGKK